MFYRPEAGHGLPHNPFNAIVAPRPIAWVSTRSRSGDNLAPYSFFNAIAYVPPQVMFASTSAKPDRKMSKDTVENIAQSRVFCVNIAGAAMAQVMNDTSAAFASGTSEFDACGLTRAECETIDCPRVEGAAAALECRATRVLRLAGEANFMVLGVVTGVHIRDDLIRDGRFDLSTEGWLSRLGYFDFAATHETFEMLRPEVSE